MAGKSGQGSIEYLLLAAGLIAVVLFVLAIVFLQQPQFKQLADKNAVQSLCKAKNCTGKLEQYGTIYTCELVSGCTNGLMFALEMNGDTKDFSENGLDGFIPSHAQNNVNCNSVGKFNQGCSFDGVWDRIDLIQTFVPPQKGTATAWIYPTAVTQKPRIMGALDNYEARIGDPAFPSSIGKPANHFGATSGFELNSNTEVPLNEWTHLAFTYGGDTQTRKIYINGELDIFDTGSNNLPTNPVTFSIGTSYWKASEPEYFTGYIDQVTLWNRVLTDAEIRSLASE